MNEINEKVVAYAFEKLLRHIAESDCDPEDQFALLFKKVFNEIDNPETDVPKLLPCPICGKKAGLFGNAAYCEEHRIVTIHLGNTKREAAERYNAFSKEYQEFNHSLKPCLACGSKSVFLRLVALDDGVMEHTSTPYAFVECEYCGMRTRYFEISKSGESGLVLPVNLWNHASH